MQVNSIGKCVMLTRCGTCCRYTWKIYSERLMTLTGVYSFWKHVSKLERRETRRYLEMFYILKFRDLVSFQPFVFAVYLMPVTFKDIVNINYIRKRISLSCCLSSINCPANVYVYKQLHFDIEIFVIVSGKVCSSSN